MEDFVFFSRISQLMPTDGVSEGQTRNREGTPPL
jgi:hypothetical protein